MNTIEYIDSIREIMLRNNITVSDIEMTQENYDDNGNLIYSSIPTVTTELGEIGAYGDACYLTIIMQSDQFTEELFDSIAEHQNVQIYGYKDFLNNYYPANNCDYQKLSQQIAKERLVQIQFNFKLDQSPPESTFQSYHGIETIFKRLNIKVNNQLLGQDKL